MDESIAMHGREEKGGAQRKVQALQTFQRGLDRLLIWTGYLSGALFIFMAFFITYDVLARTWGSQVGLPTTRVTDEISGYILALAATWGLAYTLRMDAHVRIDVLLPYMPPRLRAFVDVLTLLCMGFFATMVSWKTWVLVLDSLDNDIRSSTYLLTPLFFPQAIVGLGFSLLALTALCMAMAAVLQSKWCREQPVLSPEVTAAARQEEKSADRGEDR